MVAFPGIASPTKYALDEIAWNALRRVLTVAGVPLPDAIWRILQIRML
jgi:hypothetical protein